MRPHGGQLHHKWQQRHNPRNTRLQLTCSSWLAKRKTHKVRKHEDTHSNICYAFGQNSVISQTQRRTKALDLAFGGKPTCDWNRGRAGDRHVKQRFCDTRRQHEIYRTFQNVHSSYLGRCNGRLLAPTINWWQYRVTVNFFRGTAAVRRSGRFSI